MKTVFKKVFQDEQVRVVEKDNGEIKTYVIYDYVNLPQGRLRYDSGLVARFGIRFFTKQLAEKHFQEAKANPNKLIVKLSSQEIID